MLQFKIHYNYWYSGFQKKKDRTKPMLFPIEETFQNKTPARFSRFSGQWQEQLPFPYIFLKSSRITSVLHPALNIEGKVHVWLKYSMSFKDLLADSSTQAALIGCQLTFVLLRHMILKVAILWLILSSLQILETNHTDEPMRWGEVSGGALMIRTCVLLMVPR